MPGAELYAARFEVHANLQLHVLQCVHQHPSVLTMSSHHKFAS